jgi:AraC-like DNA-binding protein/mannose-6-phosphate isomerase-like protein (cupin superfamily)
MLIVCTNVRFGKDKSMVKPDALLEPMDMPDPYFPVKVHRCRGNEYGQILFPNHWHKHIELLLFESGQALIECNSIPYTLKAGDFVFVNSNDLHSGVALSDDVVYFAIIFDPALLKSESLDAVETKFITPIIQNLILFHNKIELNSELKSCLHRIISELEQHQFGYELSVKSLLYQALTLFIRHHVAEVLTLNDYKTRIKNLERFTPILQYIEAQYNKELSVEQLAAQTGLSRFHFSRMFKELTGRTLTEYINGVRIRRAEYLLCNTPMTVSEVALATGFHDIYYFSRMFKKAKNVPPSRMQQKLHS